MKIHKFRRSHTFVEDSEVCCLKATAPNSAIPNLAAKRMAKLADEPEFNIFLRSKVPAKTTKWQQQMLSNLFEKGELTVAIEKGMKDYEKHSDHEHLVDYEKKNRDDIKRNGVLPHVTLLDVVVDDIKREVILSLSSEAEGNLEEHGIIIYLKGRGWKFDSDHLNDYLSEVEDEESERDFPDFEEETEKTAPVETKIMVDVNFLFGTWVYDGEADREWRKKQGTSDEEIESSIRFCDLGRNQFEFSEKSALYWQKYSPWLKPAEWQILQYLKSGNKISIKYQYEIKFRDGIEKGGNTLVFFHEDGRLRNPNGGIYKRKTDPSPDQGSPTPK